MGAGINRLVIQPNEAAACQSSTMPTGTTKGSRAVGEGTKARRALGARGAVGMMMGLPNSAARVMSASGEGEKRRREPAPWDQTAGGYQTMSLMVSWRG